MFKRVLLAIALVAADVAAQEATTLDAARRQLTEGSFAEAVASFRALTVADSTSVIAWRGLASALHRLERYPEALAALDRAVALAPDDFAVRFNRGLTLSELGRMPEAVSDLEASVRARSDFAPAWTELGAAKALLDRGTEARDAWRRAAAIDSTYIWTRYYRGQREIADGNFAAAVNDLDAVAAKETLLNAQLWRWVAHRLDGRNAPPIDPRGTEWPASIASYLRGELSDSQLVTIAREQAHPLDDRRLASAWFYIGVRHLADGDRTTARQALGMVVRASAPRHAQVVAAEALLRKFSR